MYGPFISQGGGNTLVLFRYIHYDVRNNISDIVYDAKVQYRLDGGGSWINITTPDMVAENLATAGGSFIDVDLLQALTGATGLTLNWDPPAGSIELRVTLTRISGGTLGHWRNLDMEFQISSFKV